MSGFVTTTSTVPAAWAGVSQVISVLSTKTTFVALSPPKVTVAPSTKLVPVIETGVLPKIEPLEGVTEVTVGVASSMYILFIIPKISATATPTSNTPFVTTARYG